jgi:hypothetical protein
LFTALALVGCSFASATGGEEKEAGAPTGSPAEESSWPADKSALESALPTEQLGPSTPLVDAWDMAYGTSWELLQPVTIAGVSCKDSLQVMETGWSCVLAAPFTFADQKVTQRAGTKAQLGYGKPSPMHLSFGDLEPVPTRLVVEGIPCADFVYFSDGRFSRCILASDHAFGTIVLPADSDVERAFEDQLQVCVTKPVTAPGQVIPADTCFVVAPDGTIDVHEDGFGL